jgi:MG2 domain/Alpha-2-macroglobulin family
VHRGFTVSKSIVRPGICVLVTVLTLVQTSAANAGGKHKKRKSPPPRIHLLMDSPYQLWNRAGTKIHLVAFDQRFRPLRGATVLLGKKRLGRTNRHGTFIFGFRSKRGWRGGKVVVRKKIRGVMHRGSLNFSAYRRTSSFAKTRVYLYTDRQWYRPGGKIRARVIAWSLKQKYRPAAGRTATFTLSGPSGGEIGTRTVKLDAFGAGHVRFDLAERENGSYTLTAKVGRQSHERTLKVAWFKRPELEIRHAFPSYLTNRTRRLRSHVTLIDVMGRSPQGGTLTVEASGPAGASAVRTFKLDGRVSYRVAFTPTELRQLTRKLTHDDTLSLNIEVRQKNATESDLEHELTFVRNPYKAVVELDREKYRVRQPVVALVKLTDLDNNPVRRKRVQLVIGSKPDRVSRIWRTTNKRGVATFRFRAPSKPMDKLMVTAHVRDFKNELAEATAVIKTEGSMESRLGKAQVVQGGWVPITVTLRRGFRPMERVLHCDVTDYTGAIVAAFTLPLKRRGGRWVAKGRFKAPSWGSMLLTMFTVGVRLKHLRYYRRHRRPLSSYVAGLLIEGQSITVHPDQALRLKLRGLPRKARPGTRVRYNLEVRGRDGKLRDALVNAALVDSNILALGDPVKKIGPGSIFYNAQLRVMSTTGAKILTWPVVSRSWGCDKHDIALPPFDFQEGDGCGSTELFGADAGKTRVSMSACGRAGAGGSAGSVGSGGWSRSGTRPALRVRTRFAPTSLWAPALRARAGRLTHRFRLPDAISRQTLLLVASDKQGGVGVLRRTVTISMPVAIRAAIPPKMVATDELELVALVRNYTTQPLRLTFAVTATGLKVLKAPGLVSVAPQAERRVRIRIKATHVGIARLRLTARAGTLGDIVERTLEVLPSGRGRVTTHRATVHKGTPAKWTVAHKTTDTNLRARLELDFPNVIPVFDSLQRVLANPSLGGDSHASVLRTVAQVLRYKRRFGLSKKTNLRLVRTLTDGLKWLLASQERSGGFRYWRLRYSGPHRQPDPYHTAYLLETLLDLKGAGINVPPKAMRRAAWYLLTHRAPDGLWNVAHLAFWEGKTTAVRTGLSAEIFRAVARASHLKCQHKPNARLVAVAKRMRRLALVASRDPRTIAAALEGLHALYSRCLTPTRVKRRPAVVRKMSAARRKLLIQGAGRLLRLKKNHVWEPSWFSAYGGTLMATATALVLLHRLDRRRFRAHLRSGLRYLLERRHAWGEWHNERGTAATLRALLELGASARKDRLGGIVTVLVNGKRVRRIVINPRDPYGSAINLRRLRLSKLLSKPNNTIEVRYSGRPKVPARLVVQRWSKQRAPHKRPVPHKRRSLHRPPITAQLIAPAQVVRGRPFFAVLDLTPRTKRPHAASVVLRLPTNVQLRAPDLARLQSVSRAYRARLQGRLLVLHLPPLKSRRRLPLRLTPHVTGKSHFLAPGVTPLRAGHAQPSEVQIALEVRSPRSRPSQGE